MLSIDRTLEPSSGHIFSSKLPVLIAVDGPDRVGKTSLVQAIQNELAQDFVTSSVRHFSKPECDEAFCDFRKQIAKDQARGLEFAIWDRSPVSETFYEGHRRGLYRTPEAIRQIATDIKAGYASHLLVIIDRPWKWSKSHHVDEIFAGQSGLMDPAHRYMFAEKTVWYDPQYAAKQVESTLAKCEAEHVGFYETAQYHISTTLSGLTSIWLNPADMNVDQLAGYVVDLAKLFSQLRSEVCHVRA